MPSTHLDPDLDPARWSRHTLITRPDDVVAAVNRFRTGLVDAVAGDIDLARTCFSLPDADSLRAWYRDSALTAGARRSRAMRGHWRSLLRRFPARPSDHDHDCDRDRDREILARDHYRCRYCAAPLVHADHLRRLDQILGDDVLGGADDDSLPFDDELPVLHPLWLLTCGTTHTPKPPLRRRQARESDLVAACLPCARSAAGWSLNELGLDDPRDRPPGEFPDWYPLLDLLDDPPDGPYALVQHALLLDGSTLNTAGRLIGADALQTPLRLSVRCQGSTLAETVATATDDGRAFQGHLALAEAFRREPVPEHLEVELHLDGDALRLVALPGATDTPNRDVIEPIPEIPELGRRLVMGIHRGISLRLGPIPIRADAVAIDVDDPMISIVITPSTGSSADAVWVRRRGTRRRTGRVDLERNAHGSWVLTPDVRLVPGELDDVVLWDLWVSWTTSDGQVSERAGRLSSDLLAPHDAVRLPSVGCKIHDRHLNIRPYFAISGHLSVRVSSIPANAEPS